MIFEYLKMVKNKIKEMKVISFYFIVGEFEMKNFEDFKNSKDLHSYIIDNTYQITTNLEKSKKIIDDQMKHLENKNGWDKFVDFFVPKPKYWKVFEVESTLVSYDIEKEFYINKETLNITQIKPSKEKKKEFVSYKLEAWCGTTIINGCEDSDEEM